MQRKIIYFFFTGILFVCCNTRNNNNNLTLLNTSGLNANFDENFTALVFLDESTGIMTGDQRNTYRKNEEKIELTRKGVIYHTSNGGKNWVKVFQSENGYFSNLTTDNRSFYAVKISSDTSLHEYSEIFESIDNGKTWNLKFSFPTYIRDMAVHNSDMSIIAKDSTGYFAIYNSVDSGKIWSKILSSFYPIYAAVFKQNNIYFLSSTSGKNIYSKNVVVRVQSHKIITKIDFPLDFDGYIISLDNSDQEIYVAGVINSRICICNISDNNSCRIVSTLRQSEGHFPIKLFKHGSEIMLLTGKRDGEKIKHSIFHSVDNGQTWKDQLLSDPYYASPSFFMQASGRNEIKGWIYSGSGKFHYID